MDHGRWQFLTPLPSHHITPALIPNITALPLDCLRKMCTSTLKYLYSMSPSTNEQMPEAQHHNAMLPPTTPSTETPNPTHPSPKQVPQEITLFWPPPKPLDYHCHQANTPQQPNGLLFWRRVFWYSTNTHPYQTSTTNYCQIKAQDRPL